jgi:hypothetical protein
VAPEASAAKPSRIEGLAVVAGPVAPALPFKANDADWAVSRRRHPAGPTTPRAGAVATADPAGIGGGLRPASSGLGPHQLFLEGLL